MTDLDESKSPNESKLLEYLVVDSGAIIRGHGMSFPKLAKKIVTVQEVLVEIRDSKARQFLDALPYDIDIRSPSDEAMRAIAQFSKKTGDFAALSLTDIKLMALLYSLEVESKGSSAHIRSEPKGRSSSLQSKSEHVPSSPRPTPDSQHVGMHSTSLSDVAVVGDSDEQDDEPDVIEQGTGSLQENPSEGAADSAMDHVDEDDDIAVTDLSDEVCDRNAPSHEEGSTTDDALTLSKSIGHGNGVRFLDDEDFPPLAKAIGVFDDEEFPPLGQAMRVLEDVDDIPELDVALEVENDEDLAVENEALHDLCCGHLGHEHEDDNDAMGSAGWTSVVSTKSTKTSQSPKSQAAAKKTAPAPKLPMSWAAVTAKPKAAPLPPTPSAWTKKEPISAAVLDVAAAAAGGGTTTTSEGDSPKAPPQSSATTAWGDQVVSTSWATIASARPPLPPSEDPPPSEVSPPPAQLEATQSTSITATDSTDGSSLKSKVAARPLQEKKQQLPSRILSGGGGFSASRVASERAALEDDGKGWVNSSNIGAARAHGGGFSLDAPRTVDVDESALTALVTTDFSMQNVLLQMSLNVMSVDGLLLRRVKQFVLRCIGCHTVHYDMDRLFCSKCGGAHMTRVAASVDTRSGELRLHLKKNYHMNLRGTKFALPKPGSQKRYSGEILLREDQMLAGIWKQKVAAVRRDVRSAFGEDVTSDVGLHVNKGVDVVVGMGKKNPNAMKGRERRGKKKKN